MGKVKDTQPGSAAAALMKFLRNICAIRENVQPIDTAFMPIRSCMTPAFWGRSTRGTPGEGLAERPHNRLPVPGDDVVPARGRPQEEPPVFDVHRHARVVNRVLARVGEDQTPQLDNLAGDVHDVDPAKLPGVRERPRRRSAESRRWWRFHPFGQYSR